MGWIKDGETVKGVYCGQPVEGVVVDSRVTYGGKVHYTVDLSHPIKLRWRDTPTTRVIFDETQLKIN